MRRRQTIEAGVVSAYVAVGAIAAGLAVALGRDPLRIPSWVGLTGAESLGWSVAMGLALAAMTVLASRAMARNVAWARALHEALRPAVRDADDAALVIMALASGVGEELFFRGLLVPLVGVMLSSAAFGLLHQVPGPARWAWALWAMVMGALFAMVFCVTGSILGPIVAHVAINAANLRWLRDVDLAERPELAGLPGPRSERLASRSSRQTSETRQTRPSIHSAP